MTIEQLQHQLEQGIDKLRAAQYGSLHGALQPLIPQGFRPRVTLYGPQRKKRKDAEAVNWSPESDEIRICFERARAASSSGNRGMAEASPPETPTAEAGSGSVENSPARDPLSDLIQTLDRTEARPGFNFVALKWFRDLALPEEGFAWAQSDSARRDVLRGAIEKRLILTSKVPNPRSPQFPVTSIRLNRLLPEVQAILGTSGRGGEDFEPVAIRGESLSTTILRERR
jgi:hypothetical protein